MMGAKPGPTAKMLQPFQQQLDKMISVSWVHYALHCRRYLNCPFALLRPLSHYTSTSTLWEPFPEAPLLSCSSSICACCTMQTGYMRLKTAHAVRIDSIQTINTRHILNTYCPITFVIRMAVLDLCALCTPSDLGDIPVKECQQQQV